MEEVEPWWVHVDYLCAWPQCRAVPTASLVYVGEGMASNMGWRIAGTCQDHVEACGDWLLPDVATGELLVVSAKLAEVFEWLDSDPSEELAFISITTKDAARQPERPATGEAR